MLRPFAAVKVTAWFCGHPVSVALLFWAVLAAGCAGSREHLALPFQKVNSVAITFAKNKTMEPGLEERVTDILVQEFQRDGRFQVKDPYEADVLIEPVITKYAYVPATYDDDLNPIAWGLDTTVAFTVTDRATGQTLMRDRPFSSSGRFVRSQFPGTRREDEAYRVITEEFISACFEGW